MKVFDGKGRLTMDFKRHASKHGRSGADEVSLDADQTVSGRFAMDRMPSSLPLVSIGFVIDGGGAEITTGSKGYLEIPFDCTVTGWTILADQSGSIVVDVKKCTYGDFPTNSSIAGTEKPTLSSAQKNHDLDLVSWTTAITAGDILEFVVDSVTGIERVKVSIRGTR